MPVKPAAGLCPPKAILEAATLATLAAIPGKAAFEYKDWYNELRLEAEETMVEGGVKCSGCKFGLASGEGVGIEAGGDTSRLDDTLVIFVVEVVVGAMLDVAENAVAHG